MIKKSIFVWVMLCSALIHSQQKITTNIINRTTKSLNGYWKYIVDPYENGFYNYRYEPFENQKNPSRSAFFRNSIRQNKSDLIEYNFDKMDTILVPSDWNSQKENLFYYEGSVWYKKSFDYTKKQKNNRVFLYIGAANYKSNVYVNGKKVGEHIGGFTPFQFEITDLLKEKDNFVIFKIDNKRHKNAVPTLNTDWWNYGGITRDVNLVETSATYIDNYKIQLDQDNSKFITGKIRLDGKDKNKKEVTILIPELRIKKKVMTDNTGQATFSIKSRKIKYWSPKNPKLYEVTLKTNEDSISEKIGFRTIQTQGTDILLNGESIFLKGICLHEEKPFVSGRANSYEDSKQLLKWVKDLGCNYVRLAHYPHNEYILRLADEMGILVWEENPVYWTIAWGNEDTYRNAQNQMAEAIERDFNRASVIIWSMANETPTTDDRLKFLTRLAKFTKKTDPTRLISAALEHSRYQNKALTRTIEDPFAEIVDILNFNQYMGWYYGDVNIIDKVKWHITQNKPVMISEFGAGAKFGLHGEKDDRWTEEYQAHLFEKTLKMLDGIEQLRGMSPWVLVDFRSPRRLLPEIQDTFNRKGLISDKGEKKMAFYVLQEYYKSK